MAQTASRAAPANRTLPAPDRARSPRQPRPLRRAPVVRAGRSRGPLRATSGRTRCTAGMPRASAPSRTMRRFRTMHVRRQPRGQQRQRDIRQPQRVGDRVGDADRRGHAVALADALGAQRGERRRRLAVQDQRLRHLHRGRDQVIGQRAGEEAAVRRRRRVPRTARRPAACAKPPVTWPASMPGCSTRPQSCIVTYLSIRTSRGVAIDLDRADVEDEAVAKRAVDLVGLVRRGELRRRPEHRLAQRRRLARRQRPRRPMARRGEPGEAAPRCPGCRARGRGPPANTTSSTPTLSCAAAMRASRSRSRIAARCAVPATAAAKRLE